MQSTSRIFKPSLAGGTRTWGALGLLFMFGLQGIHPASANPAQADSPATDWLYSLRPHETLGSVGETYLDPRYSWHELVRYNQLAQATPPAPGSVIRIPVAWLKQQPAPATVVMVQGEVLVRRAQQGPFQPLRTGASLNVGDEIQSRRGNVSIRFADGSTLRLNDESHLLFNTLTRFGDSGMVDTRARLLEGELSTDVQPQRGNKSRYEIATPSAVAAVRGTRFRIQAERGMTQVEVNEGLVHLQAHNRTLPLAAGFGGRSGTSAAASQAVPLLPAPELEQPPAPLEELPYRVDWQPVHGATHYTAELYAENALGPRLRQQQLGSPEFNLDQLDNGQYLLALRGVDRQGFHGQISAIPFEVQLQARPALLQNPPDQASLTPEQARFSWEIQRSGDLGSLQIATGPDFQPLLAESPFSTQRFDKVPATLPPGRYFWRVATQAGGTSFNQSAARQFTLIGQLPDVRIAAVNYQKEQARLYWAGLDETEQFLVQVARDPEFTQILREEQVQGTRASVQLPDQQTYYARVRGVASEFYRSQFGPARELRLP